MRIAIGGFQHETNKFSRVNATFGDFERADHALSFQPQERLAYGGAAYAEHFCELCFDKACTRLKPAMYDCLPEFPVDVIYRSRRRRNF